MDNDAIRRSWLFLLKSSLGTVIFSTGVERVSALRQTLKVLHSLSDFEERALRELGRPRNDDSEGWVKMYDAWREKEFGPKTNEKPGKVRRGRAR